MIQAGFTTNFPEFNRQIARKIDMLGKAAPLVLKQEAGALARTLIKISGGESIAKTKQSIESKAHTVFGEKKVWGGFAIRGGKHGLGDVDWYDWKHTSLRGIAKDVDVRDKSADELYTLFKRFQEQRTRKGMVAVGTRGKQTVYVWQKYVASMTAFAKMVKRIQGHIGRRQAGWLKAWRATGSPEGSIGPVPRGVLKHEVGALGGFIDNRGDRKNPSFTLINTAKGASFLQPIIQAAMKIRAKAIAKDLLLYWKGIKKV